MRNTLRLLRIYCASIAQNVRNRTGPDNKLYCAIAQRFLPLAQLRKTPWLIVRQGRLFECNV